MCFDNVTGSAVGWMCPTDRRGLNLSTLSSDRERLCSMCQPSFPSPRETSSRYKTLILLHWRHYWFSWILWLKYTNKKLVRCRYWQFYLSKKTHELLSSERRSHKMKPVNQLMNLFPSVSLAPEEKAHRKWHRGHSLPGRSHTVCSRHDRLQLPTCLRAGTGWEPLYRAHNIQGTNQ